MKNKLKIILRPDIIKYLFIGLLIGSYLTGGTIYLARMIAGLILFGAGALIFNMLYEFYTNWYNKYFNN